jgi:hypothetical protein
VLKRPERHSDVMLVELWQIELRFSRPDIQRGGRPRGLLKRVSASFSQDAHFGQNALPRPEEVKLWAQILCGLWERRAAQDVSAGRDAG